MARAHPEAVGTHYPKIKGLTQNLPINILDIREDLHQKRSEQVEQAIKIPLDG